MSRHPLRGRRASRRETASTSPETSSGLGTSSFLTIVASYISLASAFGAAVESRTLLPSSTWSVTVCVCEGINEDFFAFSSTFVTLSSLVSTVPSSVFGATSAPEPEPELSQTVLSFASLTGSGFVTVTVSVFVLSTDFGSSPEAAQRPEPEADSSSEPSSSCFVSWLVAVGSLKSCTKSGSGAVLRFTLEAVLKSEKLLVQSKVH